MKRRMIFGVLLVAIVALLVVMVGCDKVTGGGWFINDDGDWDQGDRITFGFNAHPLNDADYGAKGSFQLVAHSDEDTIDTRVHGTFDFDWDSFGYTSDTEAWFSGSCSVNGEDGHFLVVVACDYGEPGLTAGDYIAVYIDTYPYFGYPSYAGYLGGGNIQVHAGK